MGRQSSLDCSLLSARKSEPGDKEQKTGKEHLMYMSLREYLSVVPKVVFSVISICEG